MNTQHYFLELKRQRKSTGGIINLTANESKLIYKTGTGGATFASLRDASQGVIYTTQPIYQGVVCYKYNASNFDINRTFFKFDFSSIPGNITSAILTVYGNHVTLPSNLVDVAIQLCGNNGVLAASDFSNITTLYGRTISTTTINNVIYHNIELNAAGIAKLNEKGSVRMCSRDGTFDYDNIAPTAILTSAYSVQEYPTMKITYEL